ncbi:MAG TPA: hypothetical protein VE173_12135, partial [Longimicrobiales bacterium]|nr:hypothetical protein [Longimicrobiales bacterium]
MGPGSSPVKREGPPPEGPAGNLDRKSFLELLAAGVAAATAQGCTAPPRELVVPYVEQPPEVTPGVPVRYATAFALDGFATGILASTREGRPVKIEGNPLHPASLGGSGVFEQACLYHLYDPDRD